MNSTIELRGLALTPSLGTYGPNDVVPSAHLLDLTLAVDPKLVFVDADGMEFVFDYDPLILEIDRLASERHYETQERLITRIDRLNSGAKLSCVMRSQALIFLRFFAFFPTKITRKVDS